MKRRKRTAVFLAKGVETVELGVYIDVLGWARKRFGLETDVVTFGTASEVVSTFGIPIRVEKLIGEINPGDFEAIAIPGGFAEYGFFEDAYREEVSELIRQFHAQGKIVASICVGALPIAKSGILSGRRATTYHLGGVRQRQLAEFGAEVVQERVVCDGRIITSWCPETAFDAAFALLEMLTSPGETAKVKEAMGF